MILHATHSHLYPGQRGRISGPRTLADLESEHECLVEFDDGSAATARLSPGNDDWRLQTAAYRTAAGTQIDDKDWRIRIERDRGQLRFHVLGKRRAPPVV